jgi:hypothetical protein
MPNPSPVIVAANRYRAQLAAKDAQALGRLIDAYRRAYSRLSSAVDALVLQIGDSEPTRGQVIRMARYKSLMGQTIDELQGFSALTRNEMERAAELGITLGEQHARELASITVAGDTRLAAGFNRLPKETIQQLLGFLDPSGPLYARLGELAPHTASLVSDAIVSGVAMGKNPTVIANIVRDAFGNGLTDALRFARTVQLYSYRESSRASYVANSDIVTGWYWGAELGPDTCMSCIAMHGTFHTLDETLNDHHNGRCAMIPAVKGFDSPLTEGGQEWFDKQSEATQRAMMGPGKLEAYQGGKFEFSALTATSNNDVYGEMRTEAALKDLVSQ